MKNRATSFVSAFLSLAIVVMVAGLVLGLPFMWIWNNLMIAFELPLVTFWQSLAILMLFSWALLLPMFLFAFFVTGLIYAVMYRLVPDKFD